MADEILAGDLVQLSDLEKELVEVRHRIDLVLSWIYNNPIIGEISRPVVKKERKARRAKVLKGPEPEKPKRQKRSPSDNQTGIT